MKKIPPQALSLDSSKSEIIKKIGWKISSGKLQATNHTGYTFEWHERASMHPCRQANAVHDSARPSLIYGWFLLMNGLMRLQ